MASRFFNPNSTPWRILGWVGDVLVLSLLWTVCSVPLITAGCAGAALYDSVVCCFRRRRTDYLSRFFRTLKAEFVHSLLPTLLWGAVTAGLLFLFRAVAGSLTGGAGLVLKAALLVVLLIPLGTSCWVFPLLSRFTLDFRTLTGNAVRLALGHLPSTLALGLGLGFSAWLTLRLGFLPVFFLPALLALYGSLFLEPVFRKYEDLSAEAEPGQAESSDK